MDVQWRTDVQSRTDSQMIKVFEVCYRRRDRRHAFRPLPPVHEFTRPHRQGNLLIVRACANVEW
jgi:hypothetical protein